jgi:hypothetical protein
MLFSALVELHHARWNTRGEPGVLTQSRVRKFHRKAAFALLKSGLLRMYALKVNGNLAALYYGFTAKGKLTPRSNGAAQCHILSALGASADSNTQWKISNPPSNPATIEPKLHTGTAFIRPGSPIGLPSDPKTCHASEPPFCHAVSSVHAKRICPFAF